VHLEEFGSECTLAEIACVTEIARRRESESLVGVGGGKTARSIVSCGDTSVPQKRRINCLDVSHQP
jgi:hypothetical protein